MVSLKVAVGVIFNDHGKVLIGQRTVQDQYYKKWEFPGGKLEASESAEEALQRELYEELGIVVQESAPLITLTHQYPDRLVELSVFKVSKYQGTPVGRESQALQWCAVAQLDEMDFLSGNQAIIEALLRQPSPARPRPV